jgi:hypothetical protein
MFFSPRHSITPELRCSETNMPLQRSLEERGTIEALDISPLTRRRKPAIAGLRLFDYQATRDAIARVTRRIGFHVISLCVNDQRSASIGEKRSSV